MITKILESHKASKALDKAPKSIVESYEIWARLIENHGLTILRDFKGYHDEKLSGKLSRHRSSRLNKKWRVIYSVHHDNTIEIVEVENITPHVYRL